MSSKTSKALIAPDPSSPEIIMPNDTELEQEWEPLVPNGGYGWTVVASLAGIIAVSWGMNTTYGVYTSFYIANNHFEDGTPFKYAWVGGCAVSTGLVCGPLIRRLIGRWDERLQLAIAALCISLGQILAGLSTTFACFALTQGVLFGVGLGLTLVPVQPLIGEWFTRKLSIAQGFTQAGSGLGGLIFAQTTRLALEHVGIRLTLIINGLVSLGVMIPCIILARPRNRSRNSPVKLRRNTAQRHMVWVHLWGATALMTFFISLFTLASFATKGLGLSQGKGAILQSILSAGQLIGRPAWGIALDRFGRLNITIVCYALTGVACLGLWLPANSFPALIAFATLQGLVAGTVWSTATPVTVEIVGIEQLDSSLTIFWLLMSIPTLVAQPIAISLIDFSMSTFGKTGREAYTISIGVCGGLGLVSALFLYCAKRQLQGSWTVWRRT